MQPSNAMTLSYEAGPLEVLQLPYYFTLYQKLKLNLKKHSSESVFVTVFLFTSNTFVSRSR